MAGIVPLDTLHEHKEEEVNLLGIVIEFSLPRRSNGSDFVMNLKIVDESLQEVNVNIFMAVATGFPVVKAPGDLIYFNSVKVDFHDDKPGAVYKKAHSYFAIYSGSVVGDYVPYLPWPPRILMGLSNKQIDQLRLWYRRTQLNAGASQYLISISDLLRIQYFDLVCKVLFARVENMGASRCLCLYVWDGTDAPLPSMNRKFREEDQNPSPIDDDADSISGDILKSFPRAGTVLKFMIGVEDGIDDHFNLTNDWVRLRNIYCKSSHDKWHVTSSILKIRRLPNTDPVVEERQRSYNQRISEMGD